METSAQLVEEFLDYMQDHQRRASTTISKYRGDYVPLLRVLGERRVDLRSATKDDLIAYLDRPRTKVRGVRVADATIKREIMQLRSLFKYLDEKREPRGITGRNPAKMLEAPTVHNEDPHPVPDELWLSVWTADLDDSERVAYGLAYLCGLRRAEATGLRALQFQGERIVGLVRKGGYRQGIPFASAVAFAHSHRPDLVVDPELFLGAVRRLVDLRSTSPSLLPWRDERSPLRLTRGDTPLGVVNPDLFNRRLMRRLASLGHSPTAFTPHAMRHSFCTNAIDWGMPIHVVADLAGHSSIEITRRYVRVHSDPFGDWMGGPPDAPSSEPALRSRGRFGVITA